MIRALRRSSLHLLAAAAVLPWAAAGCLSAPPTDLEVLRSRTSPPSLEDIHHLEQDRIAHAAAKAHFQAHPAGEYRETHLEELRLCAIEFDQRRALILDRAAERPLDARRLFEELESTLLPLSSRRRGIEQKIASLRVDGRGDLPEAERLRGKLPPLEARIAYYEAWQNQLAARRGHDRTAAHGWPALDGAAQRRRMAMATPDSGPGEDE